MAAVLPTIFICRPGGSLCCHSKLIYSAMPITASWFFYCFLCSFRRQKVLGFAKIISAENLI